MRRGQPSLRWLLGLLCAASGAGCFSDVPELLPRPSSGDEGFTADLPIDSTMGGTDGAHFDGKPPGDATSADRGEVKDMGDDMRAIDMAPGDDMRVIDMTPGEDMSVDLDMIPGDDMQPEEDMSPPDLEPELDFGPFPDLGPIGNEVCNGIDDNLDGIVDNAPVCARTIAQGCRVFLGWAEGNSGPNDGSESWGRCPGEESDNFDEFANLFDDVACRGTHGTGLFYRIGMPTFDDVDDDDDMGIAFRCDPALAEVGQWYQSHCRVWIGQADNFLATRMESWDDWGGCLAGQLQDGWRCESSGGDGRFHRMSLNGDVDENDAFGVAFRCDDPEDPARAQAAMLSVAVFLAWDSGGAVPADGSAEWGACPGPNNATVGNTGDRRCASSRFDGRFHRFETADDVGADDAFGIALVPHPDAR